jgi:simple sugar transport system permease protein
MVAWLAKFNPIVMILTAFLFIFVSAGGQEISVALGYDAAYSDVFIGIMLFFIIGCEFFINYKIELSTRGKKLFSRKNKKEEN